MNKIKKIMEHLKILDLGLVEHKLRQVIISRQIPVSSPFLSSFLSFLHRPHLFPPPPTLCHQKNTQQNKTTEFFAANRLHFVAKRLVAKRLSWETTGKPPLNEAIFAKGAWKSSVVCSLF